MSTQAATLPKTVSHRIDWIEASRHEVAKVWSLRNAWSADFDDNADREKFSELGRERPRSGDPILKREWRRSKEEIRGVTS